MDEGIKININDAVDILEEVQEIYYRKYHLMEISEDEFFAVIDTLKLIYTGLEELAEETDETNVDIS